MEGNNRSEKNDWRTKNGKGANAYISNRGEGAGNSRTIDDTQWRYEMSGERGKELERENEDLKRKIMELEEAALTASNGFVGKYGGKNKIRKKDAMTMTDRLNSCQINEYLKQNLFPHVKFLPPKWMRYSDKDKTLCARIMTIVTTPTGSIPTTYWDNVLS